MALYENINENNLETLTDFFKVLGNPTRIHILFLLMERDTSVGELVERLGYTQSAVSHQLMILKTNRLVRQRREGKLIFYTLADDNVCMVLEKGVEHIMQRYKQR